MGGAEPGQRPGRPSQPDPGQIKAPGTVLIVNRNGVVFDGASQVNVRNLAAAAGRISDEQFRERGLYGAQGSEPSFTDALGKVEVRPGARIDTHAPGSVTQGGGYVLLLGGEVHNAGAISAPRGRRSLPPATASSSGAAWAPARTPCRPRGATRSREPGGEPGWRPGTQHRPDRGGRGRRDAGRTPGAPGRRGAGHDHHAHARHHPPAEFGLTPRAASCWRRNRSRRCWIDDDGSTALDSQRNALIKESAEQTCCATARRRARSTTRHACRTGATSRASRSSAAATSSSRAVSLALATGGQIAATASAASWAQGAELDVAGAVGVRIAMASNSVKINVQGNELRDAPNNATRPACSTASCG